MKFRYGFVLMVLAVIGLSFTLAEDDTSKRTDAEQLLKESIEHYKNNELEPALKKLDRALELDPTNRDGLAIRLYYNVSNGIKLEQVLSDLHNTVGLEDDPHSWYIEFGYMYIDSDQYPEALALADQGLEQFPDVMDLYLIRGQARLETDQLEGAVADLKMAVENRPDYEYALSLLAKAQFANGESKDGLKTIKQMLKSNPESHLALHIRANYYADTEKYKKAIADLKKALEFVEGDSVSTAYYMGVMAFIYQDSGDQEEACQMALAAWKLGDNTAFNLLDACGLWQDDVVVIPNTTLNYTVAGHGQYEFLVDVKEIDNEGIQFDWEMTNSPDNKGSIVLEAGALESSFRQHNRFSAGEDRVFTDRLTVWVSRAFFQKISEGEVAVLETENTRGDFMLIDEQSFVYKSDSQWVHVDVLVVQATEFSGDTYGAESRTLWILKNIDNPLILKMDMGWTIELQSVEYR